MFRFPPPSIGSRLLAAFSLMLVVLGTATWIAAEQTHEIGERSKSLVTARMRAALLAHEALAASHTGTHHLHELLFHGRPGAVPAPRAHLAPIKMRRDQALGDLLEVPHDPQSQNLVQAVARTQTGFVQAFEETIDMLERDPRAAGTMMFARTMPALSEMSGALERLALYQTARAQETAAQITALQNRAHNLIWTLGTLCVLLVLVTAVLLTRSITMPLGQAVHLAREIARGKLDGPLPAARRDEVGTLIQALDAMRQGIGRREQRISQLAYFDTLTGLPNRTLFGDRLQQAAGMAAREGASLSVLMIDLDRFKQVNDVLGHPVGDRLLGEVSRRLSSVLTRKTDTLARIGGDEFAVLLPGESGSHAVLMARRILTALDAPVLIDEHSIDVGASIGIASLPEHGSTAAQLLSHADISLYVAKKSGDGYAVFSPRYEQGNESGLSLLSSLRRAVAEDELQLYLQPKIDLRTGRCRSAEALVRWQPRGQAMVPPDRFIPFAEQTGYIRHITQWVLDHACRLAAHWHRAQGDMVISVNVSARDLSHRHFADQVANALRRHHLPPACLCLEITESAILEDPQQGLQTMARLHAMGVSLSIDDFGTGYSSLSYLRRLPVSELKIDKSFIRELGTLGHDDVIVKATIDLAHNLDLRVVAEGIEDEIALRHLMRLGCDEAQGFLFAGPMPSSTFPDWCQRWSPDVSEWLATRDDSFKASVESERMQSLRI